MKTELNNEMLITTEWGNLQMRDNRRAVLWLKEDDEFKNGRMITVDVKAMSDKKLDPENIVSKKWEGCVNYYITNPIRINKTKLPKGTRTFITDYSFDVCQSGKKSVRAYQFMFSWEYVGEEKGIEWAINKTRELEEAVEKALN